VLEYTPEAENQLAMYWLFGTDRLAITAAQRRIDQYLCRDPRNPGHEFREGMWRLEVSPVVVLYEIDDSRRLVTVTGFALLKQ
jgi:mRNA-degrading endonuclease RelE of RelBE toxin-antitoxin system